MGGPRLLYLPLFLSPWVHQKGCNIRKDKGFHTITRDGIIITSPGFPTAYINCRVSTKG